ncbi:MAG: nucleotide exchange factor GrpE [Verrucomicrobiota bacterium]|nr:nucleotide exchange factor GrpE [Verrucomicrobiota bacterium]
MDDPAERFSGSYPCAFNREAPSAFVSVSQPEPAGSPGIQEALAAQKEDYLQLAADFDNFRKRTRRDSEQQAAAEKESFIRDLLPTLDNLERALASEQSSSSEQLRRGVEMTLQQLDRLLHRHGIQAVEDVGRPFDPHRHEAVSLGHDSNQPDQIVLEVVQRGYCRGDKMFRPAKVIVNDPGRPPGGGRAG